MANTHDSSIVISVFAIVILSIIGGLFLNGSQSLMGAEEDPKDGAKVATTVFGAVAIYGVSLPLTRRDCCGCGRDSEVTGVY